LKLSILDSALRYTKIGLNRFPENKSLISTKAYIFERAGVSDSAINNYKKLLILEPNRADLFEKIGNIHYRNKNYASSFLIFDKIVKNNPDSLNYIFKASECLEQRGRYQESIDYLIENGEDFEDDPKMIARLKNLSYKLDNNIQPVVETKPAPIIVEKKKTVRKVRTEEVKVEPERRIFNSNIGPIEAIQKRSGLVKKDTTRN
jgi:tetratricopeptide (TPR) repeat protein